MLFFEIFLKVYFSIGVVIATLMLIIVMMAKHTSEEFKKLDDSDFGIMWVLFVVLWPIPVCVMARLLAKAEWKGFRNDP